MDLAKHKFCKFQADTLVKEKTANYPEMTFR